MQEPEFLEWKARLQAQGSLRVGISGASMSPVLRQNTKVTVVPAKLGEIKKFDILVFYNAHSLVCHFVRETKADQVVCDSYQFADRDTVPFSAVLGKVVSHRLSMWQRMRCRFKRG